MAMRGGWMGFVGATILRAGHVPRGKDGEGGEKGVRARALSRDYGEREMDVL